MRIVIVFESMYGATEQVARAVADGIDGAEVVNVDHAPADLTGVELLVVGGPTHAHGMSRAATRESAAQRVERPMLSRTGVREWLDSVGPVPRGLATAAFDTRLEKARVLTGAASLGVAKRLRRLGCRLVVPAESFFVGTDPADAGPKAGELDRARAWGAALGAAVRRTVS
ncbi:flavodoxin family protein [Amycolatopsis sp. NPDC049252]|uniref:flavodoxin family protein n=1 Tax=Amycolatopsis sp. NPDC049252 TaxID=3363933 RepID=UPI00371D0E04